MAVPRVDHVQVLVLRFERRLALVLAVARAPPVHDVSRAVRARLRKAVPLKHQISATVVAVRFGGLFQLGTPVVSLRRDDSHDGD